MIPRLVAAAALVFACLVPAGRLCATDIPPGGTEINGGQPLRAYVNAAHGTEEALPVGRRVTVTAPDKPFSAQFSAPCGLAVAKGEPVLVVIKARVASAAAAAAGLIMVKLQLSAAPYTAFASGTEIEIQRGWAEFPVTFVAEGDIPAGKGAVVLLCGHKAQTLEVESVRVITYPAGTATATFPRIRRTYAGREADAPWRKAALERIEQQRKADLSLSLTKNDGTPLADAEVKLTLRRHEFGFGSALTAKHLTGDSLDDQRYREIVARYFSIAVFENDLKDGNWEESFSAERRAARNAELDQSFTWLAAHHIPVRGHYLMQIATPYNLHDVKDPIEIRNRIIASVAERMNFVKDRVCEWDVINHPIAWSGADMLNTRPGLERLDREVHQLARSLTSLPFFVNEDQIFRPGPQYENTFAYLKALQDDGLKIDGLGNQAHFHESYLPSPEHLLAVTDRYARVVPHQAITEYDIVTTDDEDLAADYTRDLLITVFSHPAYTSFLFWGFWEGSHWKPEAASWNKDWTVRKRGQVIEEWLGKRWRTELTLKTDAQGHVQWRGFPGWYEVVAGADARPVQVTKAQPNGKAVF